MKVLLINEVLGTTSTGKICAQLAEQFEKDGHEVKAAYGRWGNVPEEYQKYGVRIGTDFDVKMHAVRTRLFDAHGFGSEKATEKFLRWAGDYEPDLVWLHNLHGYYINIELLFQWLKERPGIEKKWTLHDCWAFTGHCSHFTYVKCHKWRERCRNCPQKKEYPASVFLDRSGGNFKRKRKAFTGVDNLSVIVPSCWLAGLVRESFLKEYPVSVRHNEIDPAIFRPTHGTFREDHNIKGKMVLGVANVWNERKGFGDFLKLAGMLGDEYTIVLAGLTKKQIRMLPQGVIGIEKTDGQKELASVYTDADIFVNLTYEDNYPTVNLEAQACGTPCITYRTGGSPESVPDSNVVRCGDLQGICSLIKEERYRL
ncbi:MAG: glycosyltransferase [Blautia sp.]|nr:glycosyltransferase [Blautia sp.]MCM1202168.1 glycosyltransferase [Bacteroides fragilis]